MCPLNVMQIEGFSLRLSCDQTIICKEKALELTYVRRLLVLALDLLVSVHTPSRDWSPKSETSLNIIIGIVEKGI